MIGTLQIKHSDDKIIDLEKDFARIDYHDLIKERTRDDWFEISNEERAAFAKEMGCTIMPRDLEDTSSLNARVGSKHNRRWGLRVF